MKVAVTGATGFVGRHLVRYLLASQHQCRCWYRPQSVRSAMPADIDWVAGSLNDPTASDELVEGCDAVIHAALDRPGSGFRGAEGDIAEFAERNIVGTLQLIEAARSAGVKRFVLISTCAVHERIYEDRPLDEKHPCTPLTHYGAHKAALEMFVHSYGWGQAFSICAVRPTGVYGTAHPVAASKWFQLVKDVTLGREVECRGGGKEVHAADVARAAELLLRVDSFPAGECLNCYDQYVSQHTVAKLAQQLSGSDAADRGEPKEPKHQIVTQKLRDLGMQFGGDKLLRQTVAELVDSAQIS